MQLRPVDVEVPWNYLQLHAQLVARGVLAAPFDERALLRTLVWNGREFVPHGPQAPAARTAR